MKGYTELIEESLDKEELNETVKALFEQIEGQLEYLK